MKKQLDELIKRARQDKQILAVFLFGSAARGDNLDNSDIDICLMLKKGAYAPLELSRKKLEYLKSFSLDVQIFQQLPIYIKKRIIQEGKNLFCADDDELYEIVFQTIQEFEDFRPIYSEYLKEVKGGG